MSEKKETRTRSWTFIIYPDSAPEHWREKLDDLHIEWAESPLHDRDINGDGESKKPHIHVMLYFGGVKSYEQVKELTDMCNAPIPQKCHSVRSMVRYFAHLDNPDKALYDYRDIIAHGGFDLEEYLQPSKSYRYSLIGDMIDFIKDNLIFSLCDFMDIAKEIEPSTWWPILCDGNNSRIIYMYIRSLKDKFYNN